MKRKIFFSDLKHLYVYDRFCSKPETSNKCRYVENKGVPRDKQVNDGEVCLVAYAGKTESKMC